MAHNGRFGLSLRILAHLALTPGTMSTSATIAEALHTNPVVVRRLFAALGAAGFIVQRKGPQGGAMLKLAPKLIGLGDLYAAVTPGWLTTTQRPLDPLMKRVRQDAVAAMNDTTLATITKKLKKS